MLFGLAMPLGRNSSNAAGLSRPVPSSSRWTIPEAAEAAVACARELRPELTIVARARDARHAKRLYEIGASETVPDTIEASLQLSEAALVSLGIPMGLVIASIHERRAEFRKELNQPEALGGRSRRFRDAQSSAAAEKN